MQNIKINDQIQTTYLKNSCFAKANTNLINGTEPLLTTKFQTYHNKLRYLSLFQTHIIYSRYQFKDLKKQQYVKILYFAFDIAFETQNSTQRTQYALKFVDIKKQVSDVFYHQEKQVGEKWAMHLIAYIHQIGIYQYYRPIRLLGKGVSAEVFLSERIKDSRKFAIKAYKRDVDASIDAASRTEIMTLRLLNHPNIIKLYEVFISNEYLYVVLEYLEGGTLYQQLKQKGRYSKDEQFKIISDLTNGVHHLYTKRIAHRDLKLENILIRKESSGKSYVICDFGLASWIDQKSYVYQRCGTPGYIAPQILRLQKNEALMIQTKVDIFSLGVIFHILLLSRSLFIYSGDFKQLLKLNKKCKINFNHERYLKLDESELQMVMLMLQDNPMMRIDTDQLVKLDYFKKRQTPRKMETPRKKQTHRQNTLTINTPKRVLKSQQKAGSVEIKSQNKTSFKENSSLKKEVIFTPKVSQPIKQEAPGFFDFIFKRLSKPGLKLKSSRLQTDMKDLIDY